MAFRTQKISQMTPKGANLEATDLIEVSTIESGSYVTRSITGQELIDAIPAPSVDWGDIGGTLSAQTDLQSALDAKVPTSRTLTINGVTQDLSADRTFTISTGITIGSTAITSGTVGRVLFQGTGNVVQQSSSLFWDATNNRLGIGTSTPTQTLDIVGSLNSTSSLNGDLDNLIIRNTLNGASSQTRLRFYNELTPSVTTGGAIFYTSNAYSGFPANSFGFWNYNTNGVIAFATSVERMRIASTGNILIGTTTDAGFRLDVNGTARFNGNVRLLSGSITLEAGSLSWGNSRGLLTFAGLDAYVDAAQTGGSLIFRTNGNTDRGRIFSTGNWGINTTTDAGFRLDVNGTARVQGNITQSGANTSSLGFITNGAVGVYSNTPTATAIGLLVGCVNNTGHTAIFTKGNNSGSTAIRITDQNVGTSINHFLVDFVGASGFGIANGTTVVNASAQVEIQSTTKGFLPPRMTTTQKNAIASPAAGLVVYDTTLNKLCVYTTAWETVTSL